ncbi:MAG: hypothetical protein IKM61_09745 [Eubacteriaceae bacterium]|nr:hypothetical protein [Eubacteriaceae bacterium]
MKNSYNICIMLMGISVILAAISFDNSQIMALFGLIISGWGFLREVNDVAEDKGGDNDDNKND